MAQPHNSENTDWDAPTANVCRSRSISLVWLIPTVAVIVGAWLAYKGYTEQGPLVEIAFKAANGVKAGQTKVKYKDVEIGEVVKVELSKDLKDVMVSARLDKDTRSYLTTETRFWVERPRISLQGISGLSTLTAGVHISMDPSEKGEPALSFKGLDQPPIVTRREAGKLFALRSDTLHSLSVGSPVTRRQIQVGQVVGYELTDDDKGVLIHIFIESPHDRQVRPETRFWVSSGLEFKLTADGLDVKTQSVASLVVGAIAFETPDSLHPSEPAAANTAFELFSSREAVANREFVEKERYVLYFKGSVRGLSEGAPVEFHGIRIGQVTDVNLQFNARTYAFDIPVMVEIEPGRIEILNDALVDGDIHGVVAQLVDRGLRGQLKTGSLLTGQLFVDLDFQKDAEPVEMRRQGDFWVLPTVPPPLETLTNRLKDFMAKVETWPIEEIGEDAGDAIRALRDLIASDNLRKSVAHFETTLANLEAAARRLNRELLPEASGVVRNAGDLVEKNAPLYLDLKQLLQEVSAAARAVRSTADYLGRHPESLIRGK